MELTMYVLSFTKVMDAYSTPLPPSRTPTEFFPTTLSQNLLEKTLPCRVIFQLSNYYLRSKIQC